MMLTEYWPEIRKKKKDPERMAPGPCLAWLVTLDRLGRVYEF